MNASEAYKLPAPKGFQCAAGCGHGIANHREAGCDAHECNCPAPYGRVLPADPAPSSGSLFELTADQLLALRELLALVHYDDLANEWLNLLPAEFRPRERGGAW